MTNRKLIVPFGSSTFPNVAQALKEGRGEYFDIVDDLLGHAICIAEARIFGMKSGSSFNDEDEGLFEAQHNAYGRY